MDDRALKRLVVITVASIAIVLLAKFMLTKTVTGLNRAAARKQASMQHQAASAPAATVPLAALTDALPSSGVAGGLGPAASAVVDSSVR